MFKYTSVLWKQRTSLLTNRILPTKAQKEKMKSRNKFRSYKAYFYLKPAFPQHMARAHRAHSVGLVQWHKPHRAQTPQGHWPCPACLHYFSLSGMSEATHSSEHHNKVQEKVPKYEPAISYCPNTYPGITTESNWPRVSISCPAYICFHSE